jgi:hypothetical protein
MIPVERLRPVITRLLEKSKKDEVQWTDFGTKQGIPEYRVFFGEASLGIGYYSPPTEPDVVTLWVYNASNELVTQWIVSDGQDDWGSLRELHLEAQRSATKWDQVLGSIEKALESKGPIGGVPF